MSSFKERLRKAKEGLYNYSETECKVRDATSSDPWGPHTPQLQELTKCTFDSQQYSELFPMLWKRLMDTGSIQHVSKALTCSLHLARHGAMRFIQDLKSRKREIKELETYRHFDADGHDDGVPVRQKAKVLMNMITDKEMLTSERQKAKEMDERRAQVNFSGGVTSEEKITKPKKPEEQKEFDGFEEEPSRDRGNSNPFGPAADMSEKAKKDKKKKKKDKKKKNKQRDNDSGDDTPNPFAAPATTVDPFANANSDPFASSASVSDPFATPPQPQQEFTAQPKQVINQDTTQIASLFAPVEASPPPPPASAPADDIISLFGNTSISNNNQQAPQQGNPFGGNQNTTTGSGNPFGQQKSTTGVFGSAHNREISTTDVFGSAQNRQMPGLGMRGQQAMRSPQQQRMMQQQRMGMGVQRNSMMGMPQQGMMGMQQQGMMGMQQQGMMGMQQQGMMGMHAQGMRGGMQQQQQGNPFGNMGMGMQPQQQPRQASNPNDPFAFNSQPQQAYNASPQRNSNGQNKASLNDAFAGLANF